MSQRVPHLMITYINPEKSKSWKLYTIFLLNSTAESGQKCTKGKLQKASFISIFKKFFWIKPFIYKEPGELIIILCIIIHIYQRAKFPALELTVLDL